MGGSEYDLPTGDESGMAALQELDEMDNNEVFKELFGIDAFDDGAGGGMEASDVSDSEGGESSEDAEGDVGSEVDFDDL